MGIPSYFSHIVKKHRHIIKKFIPDKDTIHNLYLDSNSIIYDAVQSDLGKIKFSQFEDALITAVCVKLVYYIRRYLNHHSLYYIFMINL